MKYISIYIYISIIVLFNLIVVGLKRRKRVDDRDVSPTINPKRNVGRPRKIPLSNHNIHHNHNHPNNKSYNHHYDGSIENHNSHQKMNHITLTVAEQRKMMTIEQQEALHYYDIQNKENNYNYQNMQHVSHLYIFIHTHVLYISYI